MSNHGLVIVQVDHQGHPHQQLNSRPLPRTHHHPENRPSCSNTALLTPQENVVKAVVNQQHQKNDVWTYPEGSLVMAQNGGSLVTTNEPNRTFHSQPTLPAAVVNKENGVVVGPDNANESDGEGSSSADEGYRTTSSSSGCSDSR